MLFFFKQKTAYEMRISDWSSDVCSSDLTLQDRFLVFATVARIATRVGHQHQVASRQIQLGWHLVRSLEMEGVETVAEGDAGTAMDIEDQRIALARLIVGRLHQPAVDVEAVVGAAPADRFHRSEEHTSELPPLMRTSYAVFCLTK